MDRATTKPNTRFRSTHDLFSLVYKEARKKYIYSFYQSCCYCQCFLSIKMTKQLAEMQNNTGNDQAQTALYIVFQFSVALLYRKKV